MDIIIKKLTPELADDYLTFFDTTPHSTGKAEHKCYCVLGKHEWRCTGMFYC